MSSKKFEKVLSLLKKEFGDKLFDVADDMIISKGIVATYDGDKDLEIEIDKNNKQLLDSLIPKISKILNSNPICRYDMYDNYLKNCIEWNSNPDKRLKEIINKDNMDSSVEIYNVELFGDRRIVDYMNRIPVTRMGEFVELFLAHLNILQNQDSNDDINNLVFNTCFLEDMEEVFSDEENKMFGSYLRIVDSNMEFDICDFASKMRYSPAKKYWRDDYIYNVEENQIEIKMSLADSYRTKKKYSEISNMLVESLTNNFHEIQNNKECKKYIKEDK